MAYMTSVDSIGRSLGQIKGSVLLRWLAIYSCFLAPPLMTRIAVLSDAQTDLLNSDIAGFASDSIVSIFMAILFGFTAIKSRVLGAALIFLWSVSHIANFEHVSANGDLVSLVYIGYLFNRAFFFGSALAISNKALIIAAIITPLGALFVRPRKPSIASIVSIAVVIVLLYVVGTCFSNSMDPRWRRYNVVHANAKDFLFSITGKNRVIRNGDAPALIDSLRKRDLSGTLFVPRVEGTHNVLLVLLEGCCGGMLPSEAARQNLNSDIIMPGLDSIAHRHLLYANFITHQRQTNRGEFSILSGTLPKLNSSTPKMTEYVGIGQSGCPDKTRFLPAYLASKGFETTYLQAAPLAFMLKDAFMPGIGFDSCYGDSWFKRHYASGYWGIDDNAFFEQAFELIRSKKNTKKPWFITLLTAGTHHPTTLPRDYGDPQKENCRVRAYRYLDEALCGFVGKLSADGFLGNTLVIITSDESQGISSKMDVPAAERLCQQWGLCVVLHPKTNRFERVTRRFASSDIALSVLDFLGLPVDSTFFGGRSLFRNYSDERDIYFANTYGNFIGRFTANNFLDLCDEYLYTGERFSIEPERLFFFGKRRVGGLNAKILSEIAAFADVSNASIVDPFAPDRTFDFHTGITHSIEPGGQRYLLSGQYFTIPKNCLVSVKYRGRVLSGDSCVVFLKHDLASNNGRMRIVECQYGEALPGNEFFTEYEFYSDEGYAFTEFRATAEVIKGEKPAHIAIDEARLVYTRRFPTAQERKKYLKPFDKGVGRSLGVALTVRPSQISWR
jgi:hypothetical protein